MNFQEKFYEDAYCVALTTKVKGIGLPITQEVADFALVLEDTIFYPTGGGQPTDLGEIHFAKSGRHCVVRVVDVRRRDGLIYHNCVGDSPDLGVNVSLHLDFSRRFDHMQQHSSEHIISGLVKRQFGYDNVGFGIGPELTTFDFDGYLSESELQSIEDEANDIVWRNLLFECLYPDPETLAELEYRSKIACQGKVRLIQVEGIDLCACCGTQVRRTGELGVIKLVSHEAYKGGVRLKMLAGKRALTYLQTLENQARQLSHHFSTPLLQLDQGLSKFERELASLKEQNLIWQDKWLEQKLAIFKSTGLETEIAVVFENNLGFDVMLRLGNAVLERYHKDCVVFASVETDSSEEWRVVILTLPEQAITAKERWRDLASAMTAKGGGKECHAQGIVQASECELQAWATQQHLEIL